MKIAVVGATGLVGREMMKVLEERMKEPFFFIPVASLKSAGKKIEFMGKEYKILTPEDVLQAKPEIAIFSAGAAVSREWAPKYADTGITVIDNSSAWRMNEDVPLVVPEINGNTLTKKSRIISNPNGIWTAAGWNW